MYAAAMDGKTSELLEFLAQGNEDWRRDVGSACIGIATWKGRTETVCALCREGYDVNYRNNDGQTALMLASYYPRIEIMQCLISYGARADLEDNKGRTVYHYATHKVEKHAEVIALLKEASCQPEPILD